MRPTLYSASVSSKPIYNQCGVYTRKLNNISAVYLMGTEIRFRYTESVPESWKWNSWIWFWSLGGGSIGNVDVDGGELCIFHEPVALRPVFQLPVEWCAVFLEHCSELVRVIMFAALLLLPRSRFAIGSVLLRYRYFVANLILMHRGEISKQACAYTISGKCNRWRQVSWQRLWYVVQNTQ